MNDNLQAVYNWITANFDQDTYPTEALDDGSLAVGIYVQTDATVLVNIEQDLSITIQCHLEEHAKLKVVNNALQVAKEFTSIVRMAFGKLPNTNVNNSLS